MMIKKVKVLKIVLFVILAVVFIVAPIIAREIVDLKKELTTSIGYRYILEIEKRNLFNENTIKDGKNIDAKKINIDLDASIKGKVTIKDGIVENAKLIINGNNFSYQKPSENVNVEQQYQYYIDESDKKDEIDSSWEIYIRENIKENKKIESMMHTLSYVYMGKKYSIVLDYKKECNELLERLSTMSEFSSLSCRLSNPYNEPKELCMNMDENKNICIGFNSWKNIEEIKKYIRDKFDQNIECEYDLKKTICNVDNKYKLVIKNNEEVNILNYKNNKECSISKIKQEKCS